MFPCLLINYMILLLSLSWFAPNVANCTVVKLSEQIYCSFSFSLKTISVKLFQKIETFNCHACFLLPVQPFHDVQKEELDTVLILYDVSFKS
jgi:hypothetical protein